MGPPPLPFSYRTSDHPTGVLGMPIPNSADRVTTLRPQAYAGKGPAS